MTSFAAGKQPQSLRLRLDGQTMNPGIHYLCLMFFVLLAVSNEAFAASVSRPHRYRQRLRRMCMVPKLCVPPPPKG
ncbi:hypothetical protein Q1695_007264 [Nippostrongylus brasiliensis]|nr:hypothetical protein Q1695_007264 [Nippostrongylus brasiliensis]